MLYHIPQLRMLDGVEIQAEEKVKAENLHGVDLNDRQKIFKAMLPQENFVDRRISVYEDIEDESEDDVSVEEEDGVTGSIAQMHASVSTDNDRTARQYVGELFSRVQEA